MDDIMKKLILSLLISGIAWGQGSDTIYKTLFDNVIVPSNGVLPAVNNHGQAGHQVILIFKDRVGGGGCVNPAATAYMQGSYDNVTFANFGTNGNRQSATVGQRLMQLYAGQGAYPYIQFQLVSFDNVNCTATALYTGTITQSPILQVQGAVAANFNGGASATSDARQTNPVVVGGIATDNLAGYLTVCDSSTTITVTTVASPGVVIPAAFMAGSKSAFICGFGLVGTAVGTAKLFSGSVADCTTGPLTDLTPAYNTSTTLPNIVMGGGLGTLFKTNAAAVGAPLCLAVTGAGNSASVQVSYAVRGL